MTHIVQLGTSSTQPFPLLVTTTKRPRNGEDPLIERFQVEEMAWSNPIGAALRADQQAEFDARYGEPGKEPGIKPSAEDVALFIVTYPVSALGDTQQDVRADTPVACVALRNLGDGYFEIKRMYAVPQARGTGAALSVLASLEYYLRGIGSRGLRLETGSMQDDAKRFYQKHGYKEIPLFGGYKDAKFSNCYEKVFATVSDARTEEHGLSIELSRHLFDIQMSKDLSVFALPNVGIQFTTSYIPSHRGPGCCLYPPTLSPYISVELNPITGPPSNAEVTSVHSALRIYESFANVPSIFDPDIHAQLAQHLFGIQLARHIQRSIVKRLSPAPQTQTTPYKDPGHTDADNRPGTQDLPGETPDLPNEPVETQNPPLEQPNPRTEAVSCQHPNETNQIRRVTELMVEIRDTLRDGNRIVVGAQKSLAIGLDSSSIHTTNSANNNSIRHDLGLHSLINDHGEVPEIYNLPTFKSGKLLQAIIPTANLTESELARYLRFYNIGEEMIEEGEELKIKSGQADDARAHVSRRLSLKR